eukprot:968710-Amorphochlora_amoeboformis.AAC.1
MNTAERDRGVQREREGVFSRNGRRKTGKRSRSGPLGLGLGLGLRLESGKDSESWGGEERVREN